MGRGMERWKLFQAGADGLGCVECPAAEARCGARGNQLLNMPQAMMREWVVSRVDPCIRSRWVMKLMGRMRLGRCQGLRSGTVRVKEDGVIMQMVGLEIMAKQ